MMIKICKENEAKLNAALAAVNGIASAHTFADWADLEDVARRAEAKLLKLVALKKYAVGAMYVATSGDSVPNAYKYARKATIVKIVRRAAGWFYIDGLSTEIYQSGGGERISLTEFQSDMAVAQFKAQFNVLPTEAVEVAA